MKWALFWEYGGAECGVVPGDGEFAGRLATAADDGVILNGDVAGAGFGQSVQGGDSGMVGEEVGTAVFSIMQQDINLTVSGYVLSGNPFDLRIGFVTRGETVVELKGEVAVCVW